MQYDMSQAELIEAVQFYLNEKVLRRPVKVTRVGPQDYSRPHYGVNYVLHVRVEDDQQHLPDTIVEADRAAERAKAA